MLPQDLSDDQGFATLLELISCSDVTIAAHHMIKNEIVYKAPFVLLIFVWSGLCGHMVVVVII